MFVEWWVVLLVGFVMLVVGLGLSLERAGWLFLCIPGFILMLYSGYLFIDNTKAQVGEQIAEIVKEVEEREQKRMELLEGEFGEDVTILESYGEGKYRIVSGENIYEVYINEEQTEIKATIKEDVENGK